MSKRKAFSLLLGMTMVFSVFGLLPLATNAAAFTEFSVIPSRVETSVTDVQFLVKADAVTVATEDQVRVTFDLGYTVDATPANITVSTADIANWDAECTTAWPGIAAASSVSGQIVTFPSSDLTVGQTYCFIVTAGIDNPAAVGQYTLSVETLAATVTVDSSSFSLPVVDDDSVVITASVAPFVRCDVTTTGGADNQIDLGSLVYGTVTSSSTLGDNIQIQGGTNAAEGMTWFYRSDAAVNGLFSATATDTLDGPTAESTLSATTVDCASGTPCYGIYFNGTATTATGTFAANGDFTGGTATTDAGPMTVAIYGNELGTSGSAVASQVTADFNVNATAAENTAAAGDYTDTLIFTCKADI